MINIQVTEARPLASSNDNLIEFLAFYEDVVVNKDDINSWRSVFPRQLIYKNKASYIHFIGQIERLIKDEEVHELSNLQKFVLYHILMQVEETIQLSLDAVQAGFDKKDHMNEHHLALLEDVEYLLNHSFVDWDFLIQTDFYQMKNTNSMYE